MYIPISLFIYVLIFIAGIIYGRFSSLDIVDWGDKAGLIVCEIVIGFFVVWLLLSISGHNMSVLFF